MGIASHSSAAAEVAAMVLVSGISVTPTPLRRSAADAPWCYSADAFSLPELDGGPSSSDTAAAVTPTISPNFLATQVWPSARAAAVAIERHSDPSWNICEFGCGPALPSIVAAATRARGARVIATDYDEFALQLVDAAAKEQGLASILSTQIHDLTSDDNTLPDADCYVMSDVFECATVAHGAARQTMRALNLGKQVWVFAQSDRTQREIYRQHINELLRLDSNQMDTQLEWTNYIDGREKLVLFDVDETRVEYC